MDSYADEILLRYNIPSHMPVTCYLIVSCNDTSNFPGFIASLKEYGTLVK